VCVCVSAFVCRCVCVCVYVCVYTQTVAIAGTLLYFKLNSLTLTHSNLNELSLSAMATVL
jgi:hypothetical protein